MADSVNPMDDAPDEIEMLVARCVERSESNGDPAVAEVCKDRPDLAPIVERRIAMLRRMGLLPGQTKTSAKAAPQRTVEYPDMLGDFRLIEKIGGGGMGVVFRARQESLGREVAIKLIRPEHMFFEGTKGRFRREVDAVARLHHPGIIPIYTVGEDQGVPYYAMERVVGKTLAEIVDALRPKSFGSLTAADLIRATGADETRALEIGERLGPSYIQGCLRIILQVAEALAHAHERGVGHRDIKSSNILLGEDGRVVLVDFGLATLRGASKLTQTGSALGSPHYMAPEIWSRGGDAADFRSDIYSLGVTLYELLALSLPFRGNSDEVMMRVLAGEFDPIRVRNPLVPWDVETVALKAMDLERERRYATASEFANDLRALLELRPISAARPSFSLRVRRFAQRRPGTTMAIVLAFLVFVVFPIMATLVLGTKNRQIESARAVADRNRADMLKALDAMLIGITDRDLSDLPGIEIVRRRMLDHALSVVDGWTGAQRQEDDTQRRILQIERGVVQLAMSVGDEEKALAHSTTLVNGLESLVRSNPQDEVSFENLIDARLLRAQLLNDRGDYAGAESLLAWNRAELMPRIEARTASAAIVVLRLQALANEIDLRHDQSDLPGLDRLGSEIDHVVDLAIERFPEDVSVRTRALRTLSAFALVRAYSVGDATARRALDRVVEFARKLRDESSLTVSQRMDSITTVASAADAFWQYREFDLSIQLLENALPDARALVDRIPERIAPRTLLARLLTNLAESRAAPRDENPRPRTELEQAEREFEEAMTLMRRVVAAGGESSDRAGEFAAMLGSYADLLVNLGRPEDALPRYEEAEEAIVQFGRRRKLGLAAADNRIVNLMEYGRALSRCNRPDESLTRLEAAFQLLSEAADQKTIDSGRARSLAFSNRSTLIEVLYRSKRLAQAIDELPRMARFAEGDAESQVAWAADYARCFDLAEQDGDTALRDRFGASAIERLRAAIDLGVALADIASDDRFAAMRGSPLWESFLRDRGA